MLHAFTHVRQSFARFRLPSGGAMVFYLSIFLLLGSFFLDQAAKIPWVEYLIAPHLAAPRNGLITLQHQNRLRPGDLGFDGLANLLKRQDNSRPTLIENGGLAMGPTGTDRFLSVYWGDGQQQDVSYDRMSKYVNDKFDKSVDTWKFWLMVIGFFLLVYQHRQQSASKNP